MSARLYLPPPLLPMSHLYPARRQDRLSDEFLARNKQNRERRAGSERGGESRRRRPTTLLRSLVPPRSTGPCHRLARRRDERLQAEPRTFSQKGRLRDGVQTAVPLLIVNSGYMSSLSKLTLSDENTEATLHLDSENHESPLRELSLYGCNFFFMSSSSKPTTGIWKCFGKLVDLTIQISDVLIHWPEEVFQSLVSLKNLEVESCEKLIGPAKANGGPIP